MELPERYEHWRGPLQLAISQTAQDFQKLNRWKPKDEAIKTDLVVCANVDAATLLYGRLGLNGDPKVPRSFPAHNLAVVPLPRDDELIAKRQIPPLTWLRSFRHEVAHLISFNYPQLRASPLWFQEGIAESLAGVRSDRWYQPHLWRAGLQEKLTEANSSHSIPLSDLLRSLPAELMLEARAQWASSAMQLDKGASPWRANSDWTALELLNAPTRFELSNPTNDDLQNVLQRGREFDPPNQEHGLLLCSYPEQVATAQVVAQWEGDMKEYRLRLGRSSRTEGGLLISGSGKKRIRIRLDSFGGGGSYLEPSHLTWSIPVPRQGFDYLRQGAFVALVIDETLQVQVGTELKEYELGKSGLAPPFVIEAWARGALELSP